MRHFGSFRQSDMEALFARALEGLQSELQRLKRARLRLAPSEPERADESAAEGRLAQVVLALLWCQMEAGATEAAVGSIQVG
jgi:hypothetical protein